MAYHLDAETLSLDDLRQRIEATDLVPSRARLATEAAASLKALRGFGLTSVADLRRELKTPTRLQAVARATGLDAALLALLRREVEGYFPKPVALKAFDWLPSDELARLERLGLRDTARLYAATGDAQRCRELARSAGVAAATVEALARLADLSRVQWVSPTFARMLVAAGYDSPALIAAADAQALTQALASANAGARFGKVTIGLRDAQRLVVAARYVA
jgi:hypothetical protein